MIYTVSMSSWTIDSAQDTDNRDAGSSPFVADGRMNSFQPSLYRHSGLSPGRSEALSEYSSGSIPIYEDASRRDFSYGGHRGYHDSWPYQPHFGSPPYGDWNRPTVKPEETTLPPTHGLSSSLGSIYSTSSYPHPSWGASAHALDEDFKGSHSDTGLANDHKRRASLATTSKKFVCDYDLDDKGKCQASFARKADRDRHLACVHQKEDNRTYPCNEPGCTRNGSNGFTRKDHLTEHERNFHQKQIPKRLKSRRKA